MTIRKDTEVRIACPAGSDRKYPSFYAAFHGQRGRVVGTFPKYPDLFSVDISKEGTAGVFITVERGWLAQLN